MKELIEAAREYRAAIAEVKSKGQTNLGVSRRCRLAQQRYSGMLWLYRDDIERIIAESMNG